MLPMSADAPSASSEKAAEKGFKCGMPGTEGAWCSCPVEFKTDGPA